MHEQNISAAINTYLSVDAGFRQAILTNTFQEFIKHNYRALNDRSAILWTCILRNASLLSLAGYSNGTAQLVSYQPSRIGACLIQNVLHKNAKGEQGSLLVLSNTDRSEFKDFALPRNLDLPSLSHINQPISVPIKPAHYEKKTENTSRYHIRVDISTAEVYQADPQLKFAEPIHITGLNTDELHFLCHYLEALLTEQSAERFVLYMNLFISCYLTKHKQIYIAPGGQAIHNRRKMRKRRSEARRPRKKRVIPKSVIFSFDKDFTLSDTMQESALTHSLWDEFVKDIDSYHYNLNEDEPFITTHTDDHYGFDDPYDFADYYDSAY